MFGALRIVWKDVGLRVACVTLLCLGFTYASTAPYLAVIGIKQLGMSEGQYSLLMAAMGLAGTVGALVLGHLSDQIDNRKKLVLTSLAIGCFGFGAFALLPSLWTYLFCLLVIMPFSSSVYGLLFSVVRSISNTKHVDDAVAINSTIRAIYAMSWILVPGFVGAFVASRQHESDSFAIAAFAFVLCFAVYGVFGTSGGKVPKAAVSGWAGMKAAFAEVGSKRIALPLIALSLISVIHPVAAALVPLQVLKLDGGTTRDVGIIAGLIAALEVPMMFAIGHWNKRWPMWLIIAFGGCIHAAFLASLALVTEVWHVYAISILNAVGNAVYFTMHLSYMQDLMPEKPGLGTSLGSISVLMQRGLGAAVFATAATQLGYGGSAILGGGVALAGCAMLAMLHRTRLS
jgi:SET family sugar efflux transporter-like MFS transporter